LHDGADKYSIIYLFRLSNLLGQNQVLLKNIAYLSLSSKMPQASTNEQGMVLVMGITGTGKSFFVNKLKEGSVAEGSTMDSCSFTISPNC